MQLCKRSPRKFCFSPPVLAEASARSGWSISVPIKLLYLGLSPNETPKTWGRFSSGRCWKHLGRFSGCGQAVGLLCGVLGHRFWKVLRKVPFQEKLPVRLG